MSADDKRDRRSSEVVTPGERSEAAREHNPHPAPKPVADRHGTHRPGSMTDQTGVTGVHSTADRDLKQKPVSPTTTRPGGFSP